MLTVLEARVEQLLLAAHGECCLLTAQLEKSRAARETSTRVSNEAQHPSSARPPVPGTPPPSPKREDSVARETGAAARLSIGTSTSHSSDRARSLPAAFPPVSPPRGVVPNAATQKEGTLLHLVRSSGLLGGGSRSFIPHYVVSGSAGISWYASEAEYRQHPSRPLGHVDFWVETFNSRGSRFKKAAVCWPLILPCDCPEARDASKTYFAVDYYTPNGAREQIVLAASRPAERDAWVQFLTKYIDLYLAPRAESEELQHLPRGAAVPLHRSGVIEGEAPGGNIL
ncbi:hypothetical protein LSCM1_02022 [Leishmania martiniquensis]|uniref:PH domain-containing protein n=1 Tax=Leishmania martiniquensis TaxID=1580590 RepID=A0A836H666_9TRYP|nr:hypothetical protein LSCM1_02022 [Leishmania martiniquensis]